MSIEEKNTPANKEHAQNQPVTRGQRLEQRRLQKKEQKAARKGNDAEVLEEEANEFLVEKVEKIEGWFSKNKKLLSISGASLLLVCVGVLIVKSSSSSGSQETSEKLWSAIQTARAPIIEDQEITSDEEEAYTSTEARAERALVALQEATQLTEGTHSGAWAQLSQAAIQSSMGEKDKALEIIQSILSQSPSGEVAELASLARIQTLMDKKEFDTALSEAKKLENSNDAKVLEGQILFAKNEAEASIKVFAELWKTLGKDESPSTEFLKKKVSTYIAVLDPSLLDEKGSNVSSSQIQQLMQQMNTKTSP